MKKILILLFSLTLSPLLQAQELPSQSIYVELGGAGLHYSVNYDFRFDKSRLNSWGMRIGAGGWTVRGENQTNNLLTIPVQINKLMGKDKHFFEIGGGATLVRYRFIPHPHHNLHMPIRTDWHFFLPTGETPSLMGTFNLGYRWIPVDGGVTFRANLNPIFNQNGIWPLWAGVGFGYAF